MNRGLRKCMYEPLPLPALMTVKYRVDAGSFVAEPPRARNGKQLADTGVLPGFDISPDWKRVAAFMPDIPSGERQSPGQVTFFVSFFDDLRRRSHQDQTSQSVERCILAFPCSPRSRPTLQV
jgi:hypothetical protein